MNISFGVVDHIVFWCFCGYAIVQVFLSDDFHGLGKFIFVCTVLYIMSRTL